MVLTACSRTPAFLYFVIACLITEGGFRYVRRKNPFGTDVFWNLRWGSLFGVVAPHHVRLVLYSHYNLFWMYKRVIRWTALCWGRAPCGQGALNYRSNQTCLVFLIGVTLKYSFCAFLFFAKFTIYLFSRRAQKLDAKECNVYIPSGQTRCSALLKCIPATCCQIHQAWFHQLLQRHTRTRTDVFGM